MATIYLVGGAVRDELLGIAVRDKDWLVVGATAQEMLDAGYQPVGADFPVFLDASGQEFALARRERKVAPGYSGFSCDFGADVTVEDDLLRRDLTINAMAKGPDGTLIDPFGGQSDLERRILRHVSPAFAEDPVRVLRVGRFLARYGDLGFTVAPETMVLMREMVAAGETQQLVAERVWKELSRALMEPRPELFLQLLHSVGALKDILPEVDALYGVIQPPAHHPEIDTGIHTELSLRWLTERYPNAPLAVRFAVMTHDLGKALTPAHQLPRHIGHEAAGVPLVKALCARLKVPNELSWFATMVCAHHLLCHRALELRASTIVDLTTTLGAYKVHSEHWLTLFTLACHADAGGRTGLESRPYPQAAYLQAAAAAGNSVDARAVAETAMSRGAKGDAIGAAVREARTKAVAAFKASHEAHIEMAE